MTSASETRAPAELTARERAVVRQLSRGETNKEIARTLSISPFTVRGHIQSVAKKLGCRNRVEIAAWWTRSIGVPPTSVGCEEAGRSLIVAESKAAYDVLPSK